MNDMGATVLAQYELEVSKVNRIRGGFLCDTLQGLKVMTEYKGSILKLELLEKLLQVLREGGMEQVDCLVKNAQGQLFAQDADGRCYIIKDWYTGKECDVKNIRDIRMGTHLLARCHKILSSVKPEDLEQMSEDYETMIGTIKKDDTIMTEYKKRNAELKRVRNYIRKKNHKNEFELELLSYYEMFFEKAHEAYIQAEQSAYEQLQSQSVSQGKWVHGAYHYHNILLDRQTAAVTNWEHCRMDLQISDLYLFMRKVLEKHNWDMKIGSEMLEHYDKVRTITQDEKNILKVFFSYPEKFWKISNQYLNRNKAWIPAKNIEKLQMVAKQNDEKEKFLTMVF